MPTIRPSKRWPIDVIIFEKRFGNIVVKEDRAARITHSDEQQQYKLKDEGETIKPVEYEGVLQGADGRSKVFLYKHDSGEYLPFSPDSLKSKLKLN